ncbi:hypothetical protein NB476_12905, partial [Vibrio sp. RM-44-3]|uniref:hypothetical protein n=2 Tax=unclassified Vibrio TaxID=2614977 RepID=UPI00215C0567
IGFLCLLKGCHITPHLNAALTSIKETAWLPHVKRSCYRGDWQALALEESYRKAYYPNCLLLSEFPELELFLSQFYCPILSVRFMKLDP